MQSQIILCLVMHGAYESLCLLIYDNDNTHGAYESLCLLIYDNDNALDCLMIFVIVQ